MDEITQSCCGKKAWNWQSLAISLDTDNGVYNGIGIAGLQPTQIIVSICIDIQK